MRTSLSSCTSAKFTLFSEVQASLGTQKEARRCEASREKEATSTCAVKFRTCARWLLRRWAYRWARVEVFWTFHGLSRLQSWFSPLCLPRPFILSRDHPKREVHTCCFQKQPVTKSGSTSRGPWQGRTRWKQGWSGAGKGWDDSLATVAPAQNPEQIFD